MAWRGEEGRVGEIERQGGHPGTHPPTTGKEGGGWGAEHVPFANNECVES